MSEPTIGISINRATETHRHTTRRRREQIPRLVPVRVALRWELARTDFPTIAARRMARPARPLRRTHALRLLVLFSARRSSTLQPVALRVAPARSILRGT